MNWLTTRIACISLIALVVLSPQISVRANPLNGIDKPDPLDRIAAEMMATDTTKAKSQLAEVQEYLKNNPSNVRAHLLAGELTANLGLQNFARDQFKAADRLNPGAFINEYHRLYRDMPLSAVRIAFFAREAYPDDGAVLYDLAKLNMSHNLRPQAIRLLERGSAIADPWPDTFGALAKLYLDAGEPGKALTAAQQELKKYPDNTRAERVSLLARWRLGESLDKLAPELAKLIKKRPDDPDLNLMDAQLKYDQKQYQEAVKPDLYALMQEDGGYTINVAEDLFWQLSQKVPKFDIMRLVDAEAPETSQNLRRSLLRLRVAEVWAHHGWHKDACGELAKSLKMHPYFASLAYYRLGNEMTKMHEEDAALLCYANAVREKPSDPQFRRAAERAQLLAANKKNDLARRLKACIRQQH